MSDAPAPNPAMLTDAIAAVRILLGSAERGFLGAQRDLVRMAAAASLENALMRIVASADKCAPSLDEIKLQPGLFASDACALRFAVDAAREALSQAAGRAVAVPFARPEQSPQSEAR